MKILNYDSHMVYNILTWILVKNLRKEKQYKMEKTLFINACVRDESRTRLLAERVLEKIGGDIREVNLEKENISPLNKSSLKTRDEYGKKGDFSHEIFKYAKQFSEAETLVVAAPYWDLSFPAMIKIYFEAVTVQGLTFRYTEEGIPQGLCKAKRLIYVTTAGGPIEGMNFGFEYVDALCRGFYGIEDTRCYKAELLDIVGADVDGILKKALEEIDRSEDL